MNNQEGNFIATKKEIFLYILGLYGFVFLVLLIDKFFSYKVLYKLSFKDNTLVSYLLMNSIVIFLCLLVLFILYVITQLLTDSLDKGDKPM
ncbi:MAG: hypothetical protein LBD57_04290 [Endomicrobium sp.]|jgi:hypothetical protein|uniref:hypothetical protein n=1 Tax=Candidatus Endomicrobiellum cubanum TaxID=3242325 RepID=UPI0028355B34|nr:hypothetical protein [Endomicrobium sp.]